MDKEFRKMRRSAREMESEEVNKILKEANYGTLSIIGENGYAYGVPLSYAYSNNAIYFHSAVEGFKIDSFKLNDKVSFTVVGDVETVSEKFTTKYKSVILFGTVEEVFENDKKQVLMELLKKYSPNFLEAGKEYAEKAGAKTRAFKITIEHISGKKIV